MRRAAVPALVATMAVTISTLAVAPAPAAPPGGGSALSKADDGRDPVERTRRISAVQFTSTDGSAEFGTSTPFTLTNLATGRKVQVTVPGKGSTTKLQKKVSPGRYRVTTGISLLDGATYSVDELKPATGVVKVAKPTARKPQRISKVVFGLEKRVPELALETTSTTADAVSLSWSGPGDVTDYVVRRTEGQSAAASPVDGAPIALDSATTTSATDTTVTPGTTYTYTLFATRSGGTAAPVSLLAATPSLDGSSAAYSLAPNTVMATDFAALGATALGGGKVGIVMSPAATPRASVGRILPSTARPWQAPRSSAPACVVGQGVVVPTEVAGEDAFFGTVEQCNGNNAVVDTNVPLNSAFDTLDANRDLAGDCQPIASTAGTAPPADSTACDAVADEGDNDVDGLSNSREAELGTDPSHDDTDGDAFKDGEEVLIFGTDPKDELDKPGPTEADADVDGLDTAAEQEGGTDPSLNDTDGDLFYDGEEVLIFGTDPLDPASKPGERGGAGGGETGGGEEPPTAPDPAWRPPAEQAPQRSAPSGKQADPLASAKPGVSCEGTGGRGIRLNPYIQPGGYARLNLSGGTFTWDVEAKMTVGINPQVYIEGSYSCQLQFQGKAFQITYAPVPINLKIEPLLRATAQARFELNGPNLAATIGFHTDGHVRAVVKKCTVFKVPCGVNIDRRVNSWPIAHASVGNPSIYMEGGLAFDLGITATIALGYDGGIAGAKAGFAIGLIPLRATFTAKWNNRACTEFALGGKVEVGLVAEAWIIRRSWGVSYNGDLAEFEIPYPGLSLNLPRGCG